MKPSLYSLLLFVALLAVVPGCGDTENDLPGEVRYRLLNERGEETTRFRQGENVTFSLVVSNKSDRTVNIRGFPIAGVGTVYRVDVGSAESALVGKPHTGFDCTYDNWPYIASLSPGSTQDFRISWVPRSLESALFCPLTDQKPLPRGRYRTAFGTPISFSIDNGDTKTTDTYRFSVDFEVK